jgi:hypothetical protein
LDELVDWTVVSVEARKRREVKIGDNLGDIAQYNSEMNMICVVWYYVRLGIEQSIQQICMAPRAVNESSEEAGQRQKLKSE